MHYSEVQWRTLKPTEVNRDQEDVAVAMTLSPSSGQTEKYTYNRLDVILVPYSRKTFFWIYIILTFPHYKQLHLCLLIFLSFL